MRRYTREVLTMRGTRFKTLAVGLAAVLTLTACGSGGSDDAGSDTGATTDPAEVTGTLRLLVPSYPASAEGQAALDKVVAEFQEEYPEVEVEPDFATFATLNEKIATSIAGGQPYDVLVTGIGWIPPFASQGAYLDLGEFGVTEESLAETTAPALVSTGVYDGAVYGVPLVAGPKPLALRASLFEAAGLDPAAPPSTLEELREAATALTVTDAAGNVTQAGFDFWAGPGGYRQDFVAILGALGVPLYEDGEPQFDGPEGVKALGWISTLINEDEVIAYGQQNATKAPMVTTGEAAMGFTGGFVDCAAVGQDVCDDLVYFNLQDETEAMFSGGQVASVSASSELPEAAWALIEAMRQPEALADIAALNFAVPATKDAADTEAVTSNPASTFAYENLDVAVFEGGAQNWLDLRTTFDTALDQAILGDRSAEDVLAELAEKSE